MKKPANDNARGRARLKKRPVETTAAALAHAAEWCDSIAEHFATRSLDGDSGPLPLPLPKNSDDRKQVPMATGLIDYFPDALAAVAHVSFLGNEKHNPGEPLHWARGKSMDHADCIVRHLTERGHKDAAGVRHSAQMAWRALALLQEELEQEFNLPAPRGAELP